MNVLFIGLAPVFIIALYIYFRDKYEKEPVDLLLKSLVAGAAIVIPIIYLERFLGSFADAMPFYQSAAYRAFVVAAFSEELFKFLALFFLIWNNRNFNEKFDGIVYATFISLGFAAIENIQYISLYGINVGYTRALTAVPAHGLFGVSMGFYLGMAKFYPAQRIRNILLALIIPILLHGLYDFILFINIQSYLLLFIPYLFFLWKYGFQKMRILSDKSVYRKI